MFSCNLWYLADDIYSCQVQYSWRSALTVAFTMMTLPLFHTYSYLYWSPDLLSRVLSIWAHLVLHHEVKQNTCSPALPGVGEDPDHALIMTCQKGKASHAAGLLHIFAIYLQIPKDLWSSLRFSVLGELWPLHPSGVISSPHYAD